MSRLPSSETGTARGPLPPPRPDDLVPIVPFDAPLIDDSAPAPPAPPSIDDRWQELADVLDDDGTAVATLALDGQVHAANRTFLDIVGATTVAELRPGTAAFGVLRSLLDHLPNELTDDDVGGVWHGDVDHHVLGNSVDARVLRSTVTVSPPSEADPDGRLSLLFHDVTDERRAVADLRREVIHDPLTGLANRQHILGDLARAIAEHRGRPGHVATIFVDLDHLKYVNDAFGHRAGDRLLSSTATRLEQAVRPGDRVARIGGDEFLVIGTDLADAVTSLELAERIRRALTGHLRIGELDLEFSVSIGIALTDDDVLALDDDEAASLLVSNADTAMYAAKQAGRGRCTLYTTRMRSEARERAEVAATLARAVVDDVLTVEYQPVFSTVTRRAVAAEALVRWFHPRLGRMDPATFIAVAEESGTIGRLGEQVLRRALDDLAHWRASGRVDDSFAVHVNVSRVQLASAAFVNTVVTMLRQRRLRPDQLVLEARDTSLLGRIADVDRSIRALRRAGVQIAVDNFGTGPKALAVMTDVGADVLKLDGSLALPAGSSETDTRTARAVVLLAHALEMDVVAERVASPEQLQRLVAAGCDLAQGNLLAPPARAEELDLSSPHPW